MAPTGPQSIFLKRKRDEEDLPELLLHDTDLLAIQNGTYPKTHVTIYRRIKRKVKAAKPDPVPPPTYGLAALRVTAPGEEKRNPYALASLADNESQNANTQELPLPNVSQRVWFWLEPRPSDPDAERSKRKRPVPVFESRQVRQGGDAAGQDRADAASGDGEDDGMDVDEERPRKLKRPTTKAKERHVQTGSPKRSSKRFSRTGTNGFDIAKFASLVKDLNEEDAAKAASQKVAARRIRVPKRWRDRQIDSRKAGNGHALQPQEQSSHPPTSASQEELPDVDMTGYTYARSNVPIDDLAIQNAAIGSIAIHEQDEELWNEYSSEVDEDEDDKEFDTDGEDSNAEDYYGADYPEDELSEDDEFDEPGVAYRHRRYASDDEQFGSEDADEDDAAFSGDEHDHDGDSLRRDIMNYQKI